MPLILNSVLAPSGMGEGAALNFFQSLDFMFSEKFQPSQLPFCSTRPEAPMPE